jgi:hypothetical protein
MREPAPGSADPVGGLKMPASCPGGQHGAVDVNEGVAAARRFVVNGAGGRFVPGALRPRQQQDVRVGGVSCDRFAQRPDRGTVAERRALHAAARVRQELAGDGELARELRVPGLELPSQALHGEVRADPRHHFVALERLRDEVDRTHLEPTNLVLGVIQGRQKDHCRLAGLRIFLETAARLVAVDPGHDDVEQDQQRVDPPRHLDRAFPASRHEQPVAAAVERVAQHVEVGDVVVDQQDPIGIFGRLRGGCVHGHWTPVPIRARSCVARARASSYS